MTTAKKLLAELQSQFGDGIRLASQLEAREYRSSGSIALDVALGGGWSKNIIVDVVGKPNAGKTLLFDLAAIEAARTEKRLSAIFDFEHAYDVPRYRMLGGDPDNLHLIRAENFGGSLMFVEQCTDMLKRMLETGKYACIGMDSTAAMVSKAEYDIKENDPDAVGVAYTARAMSDLLRQVVGTGLLARSGATLFFMSQMRDNIGARSIRGIPPPDKRTGGRALPHYAIVQVEVIRGETIKGNTPQEKQIELAHETKVRVRKNKCNAKQGRVAMFEIYTEGELKGLDRNAELVRLAVAAGVVGRGGRFYTFPDGVRVGSFDLAVSKVRDDLRLFRTVWDSTIAAVDAAQPVMPAQEIDDANIVART